LDLEVRGELDMQKIKVKHGRLRKLTIGDFIIPAVLTVGALIVILPVWHIIMISIVPQHVYFQTPILMWPSEITFENFGQIFNNPMIQTGFRNTVFITLASTAYNMFLNVTYAYVLLKPIPGKKLFWFILVFPMFFGGGLIPYFLLIRDLNLMNNLLAMVLPVAGLGITTVVLMQSYIRSLPSEVEEAARIDGAGDLRVLWNIILPLCKPMLATLSLFAAVGAWNRWFEGLLFMQRQDLWPLQLVLRNMLNNATLTLEGLPHELRATAFRAGLQSAAVVTAMIPIVIVYPFLQKYFVKGITLGGVKG